MKAIICDDDEIILKGLGSVIDWNCLGVEIAGTASDGRAGLALLSQVRPDLLLTDIRMPYIDGLELISEGKRLNPSLMVIVFSGYDDFSYARRALQLGVQDYLTKPIDIEELRRLVMSCARQFKEAQKDSFEEKENMLRRLLVYTPPSRELPKEAAQSCVQIVMIETELPSKHMEDLVYHLREEGFYILNQSERSCELAVLSPSFMHTKMRSQLCTETAAAYFKAREIAFVSAISDVAENLYNLEKCHQQALEVLKLKYVRGYNHSLSYDELKQHKTISAASDSTPTAAPCDTRSLIEAVKYGDASLLEQSLDQLETQLIAAGMDSYLYMQFTVGNLYNDILKELDQLGIRPDLVFENPVSEYQKLLACETIWTAMAVLRDNLKRLCQYVSAQKGKAYSKPVYRALQYIEANYNNAALSQEETASQAGLSTGRFSTLFKAETGATFTDYLFKMRMERAKELMKDPNRKIYEIAMMAGYDNIPYFSTAFKKYTGTSPSEYRSRPTKEK